MASLLKLIREDLRRRKKTAAQLKLEDTIKDIELQPGKFAAASSLTDRRTWLHFAAQQSAVTAVKLLLQHGADANARDLLERTPLHHGCFTRSEDAEEVVMLLLKAGALPNAKDCMGYSPLHMACMKENAGAITSLGKSKAHFNDSGPSGFTGLHLLCQSDTSLACIDLMLAHGANMHVYDECNRSPVDVARERGAYKAMRKLHEAHREWGEVQYLFKEDATSIGQEVARRKLSLRSSLAQMMSAVATGKAPDGEQWTQQRPSREQAPKLNARQRARLGTGKPVKGMSGYTGESGRVRGKDQPQEPGRLVDDEAELRRLEAQRRQLLNLPLEEGEEEEGESGGDGDGWASGEDGSDSSGSGSGSGEGYGEAEAEYGLAGDGESKGYQ